ncbi:glycine-rich domain-containing protein [Kitasatospora mediocidica]|uniref:glycine-rich domain-containing protein n=1 Tax=Kitasatospora mediocidica TaxID=58352 RepID=UPI0005667FA2|nr:hypothetical protein [Kitasatospora mediocidica]
MTTCSSLSATEFDSVVATVIDNNPGMANEVAARIVSEGVKFVIAGARYPQLALAPSRVVDEGWHALILHTQLYARLCAEHGQFVHHSPGYDPTNYDPAILGRTQDSIGHAGFAVDRELWAGPSDDRVPVAAKCQHAPTCAIRPMPKPEWP